MEKKRERSVPFTGSAYFKRNIGTIIGLILLIIIVHLNTEVHDIVKSFKPVKVQLG